MGSKQQGAPNYRGAAQQQQQGPMPAGYGGGQRPAPNFRAPPPGYTPQSSVNRSGWGPNGEAPQSVQDKWTSRSNSYQMNQQQQQPQQQPQQPMQQQPHQFGNAMLAPQQGMQNRIQEIRQNPNFIAAQGREPQMATDWKPGYGPGGKLPEQQQPMQQQRPEADASGRYSFTMPDGSQVGSLSESGYAQMQQENPYQAPQQGGQPPVGGQQPSGQPQAGDRRPAHETFQEFGRPGEDIFDYRDRLSQSPEYQERTGQGGPPQQPQQQPGQPQQMPQQPGGRGKKSSGAPQYGGYQQQGPMGGAYPFMGGGDYMAPYGRGGYFNQGGQTPFYGTGMYGQPRGQAPPQQEAPVATPPPQGGGQPWYADLQQQQQQPAYPQFPGYGGGGSRGYFGAF